MPKFWFIFSFFYLFISYTSDVHSQNIKDQEQTIPEDPAILHHRELFIPSIKQDYSLKEKKQNKVEKVPAGNSKNKIKKETSIWNEIDWPKILILIGIATAFILYRVSYRNNKS